MPLKCCHPQKDVLDLHSDTPLDHSPQQLNETGNSLHTSCAAQSLQKPQDPKLIWKDLIYILSELKASSLKRVQELDHMSWVSVRSFQINLWFLDSWTVRSPHLLQSCSRMLQRCSAVKIQKRSVDSRTSLSSPSAGRWARWWPKLYFWVNFSFKPHVFMFNIRIHFHPGRALRELCSEITMTACH